MAEAEAEAQKDPDSRKWLKARTLAGVDKAGTDAGSGLVSGCRRFSAEGSKVPVEQQYSGMAYSRIPHGWPWEQQWTGPTGTGCRAESAASPCSLDATASILAQASLSSWPSHPYLLPELPQWGPAPAPSVTPDTDSSGHAADHSPALSNKLVWKGLGLTHLPWASVKCTSGVPLVTTESNDIPMWYSWGSSI